MISARSRAKYGLGQVVKPDNETEEQAAQQEPGGRAAPFIDCVPNSAEQENGAN
jgi:hypothetical protein